MHSGKEECMYKGKRLTAILLSLSLTATMVPANTFAAEVPEATEVVMDTEAMDTEAIEVEATEAVENEATETEVAETEATETEVAVTTDAAKEATEDVEAVEETEENAEAVDATGDTEETVEETEEVDTVDAVGDEYNSANPSLEYDGSGMTLTWTAIDGATSYDVYRAKGRYGTYEKIATVDATTYRDGAPNTDKYENYYRIAVKDAKVMSEAASLEIEMFGTDMYVFSPNDDVEQIYDAINDVYYVQGGITGGEPSANAQFSEGRYAFAFKTGDYSDMSKYYYDMGYYMQILGLGKTPYDVTIKNVHVPAMLPDENVTCNFWMGIENLSISAQAADEEYGNQEYDFKWSVSQAAPARRLYVQRPTRLNSWWDGWASGGYIADSLFTDTVGSWSQQQYYLRNSEMTDFYGVNWNMVAQGCEIEKGTELTNELTKNALYDLTSGAGTSNWNNGGHYTFIDETDTVKEKPFLYFDEDVNEYKVFVPALRKNSTGVSWSRNNMGEGTSIDINDFYIAKPSGDKNTGDAAAINQALREGKHVILSPGIYYAEEPIHITNANTVFLGLGLATIIPMNEETGIKVDDVEGVSVAGVIIDADSYSKNMIVVGEKGKNTERHEDNPVLLQDLFIRVGGVHGGVASTDQAVVINANDVIGDDFWIWRADHGEGTGWYLNMANNGVVVNGDYVTLYGLMVEHFQEYDIIWRGEYGKTYFLQNEKCYDPQNQEEWMSHNGTVKGYAAYKVADNVKNHYAVGLGSYDVFIYTNGASIFMENSYEVPNAENVVIENCCTVEISTADGPAVGNNSIINGVGPAISTGVGGGGYAIQAVTYYSNGTAVALPDYYERGEDKAEITVEDVETITGVEEPEEDPKAEEDTSVISISSIYFKDIDTTIPLVVESGQTKQLSVGFEPEAASNRVVSWSTADSDIATVDSNGLVTGVKGGKTTIIATAGGKKASITVSVVDVAVTGLEILNRSELENNGVKTGETFMLDVEVKPSDATDKDLLFKSSAPKIATVSSDGVIQGQTEGTVTVTVISASDQTIKETVTFNVEKSNPYVPATSIEIKEGSEITINEAEQRALTAVVSPDNTTDRVAWASGNTQIATVVDGVVTGISAGTTTITAQAGEQTTTITVNVVSADIESIDVANMQSEIFVGETWKMQLNVVPKNTPISALEFKASPATTASVDEKGRVTGLSAGNALITVRSKTDSSVNTMFVIKVKDAISNVKINDTSMTVGESKSINLSVTPTPESAISAERMAQLFTFESSKPGVVSVDANGKLTAVSAGTTEITVTAYNGVYDRRTITVSAKAAAQATVTAVSAAKTKILVGETTTATASVSGNGTVTWKSSNEAAAVVDANGNIRGVAAGRATISATIGSSVQSVEIQVVKPTVKWNVSYKTVPLQLKNKKKVNKTTALQPTGLQDGDSVAKVKSSKTKVATVKLSSKGKLTITPKKVGSTKITVTTKYGAKATFTLKVQKAAVKVKSISVNKTKVSLKKGKTFQIVATKKYITALDKVTYKSSNKKVATVSSKGKIKAKKKGKATITVKCGKKTKKITVTVK